MPTIKEIIDRRNKEYDEKFVPNALSLFGTSFMQGALIEYMKVIKAYQAETIRLVLGAVRDWVSENEYCSKCCSPKKHCPEWGKNASAIDTKDFLALLTQELKDLDK